MMGATTKLLCYSYSCIVFLKVINKSFLDWLSDEIISQDLEDRELKLLLNLKAVFCSQIVSLLFEDLLLFCAFFCSFSILSLPNLPLPLSYLSWSMLGLTQELTCLIFSENKIIFQVFQTLLHYFVSLSKKLLDILRLKYMCSFLWLPSLDLAEYYQLDLFLYVFF